jgi:hypothetical protein
MIEAMRLPKPVTGVGEPLPSGLDGQAPLDIGSYTGRPMHLQPGIGLIWDHLIYAYLVESTGVYEIFAEVLRRYTVGETLPTLSTNGLRWLHATEELFFRDPPLLSIGSVVSRVRPDLRVSRRNAYWRMFGLDLAHPLPAQVGSGDQSWKRDIGNGVNSDFREKWSELLRQIWLGVENQVNTSGANATDREYIAFLAKSIKDMFNMRRQGGRLAREEFVHVSTMNWFHLTLESNTPFLKDLRAIDTTVEGRLAKVAQLVGMTPAARSRELFELADLMSGMFRAIELGFFDKGAEAEKLYKPEPAPPAPPNPASQALMKDANRIVDLWQSATGERVKDRTVGVVRPSTAGAQPLRIPASVPVGSGPQARPVTAPHVPSLR